MKNNNDIYNNNIINVKRALISVYDKEGIVPFAKMLSDNNVEIIATGETHKLLLNSGIESIEISKYTGFDEILDGRVKTLNPHIHAGILAIPEKHNDEITKYNIKKIDLVVVNLYPFENTVSTSSNEEEIIENIDIGGVALIRAAAKNFTNTCVITNKDVYNDIINNTTDLEFRFKQAKNAFAVIAKYDIAISNWFEKSSSGTDLPSTICLNINKIQDFRYGENPHQKAAFYGKDNISFSQLNGKELSYNNILDIDAAINLLNEFTEPTAVIIKHNNPCGVASDSNIKIAYGKALTVDTKSAFGGIVALNREIDENIATLLSNIFLEVIIVPKITSKALSLLSKKKNLRIIVMSDTLNKETYDIRSAIGGIIAQTRDKYTNSIENLHLVSQKQSDNKQKNDLIFAMKVCKHVKSNAIVIAKNMTILGIGAGQMSRVDSVKNAINKSLTSCNGAVLASDAFFPFSDSIELAKQAGISAIIQPGGSLRDSEIIEAVNTHNIAMYFTHTRHFKH